MKASDKSDEQKKTDQAERIPEAATASTDVLIEGDAEGGSIQISENVIAAVVRRYTLDVDGVIRFASGGIVGGIAGMIAKRNYESSMVVDLDDDMVNISVTLVLRFGVRIPDVAQAVQEAIRSQVEELTGKRVTRVNVLIQDLEDVPSASASVVKPAAEAVHEQ